MSEQQEERWNVIAFGLLPARSEHGLMLPKPPHEIKRPFAISVEIAQNRLKRVNTQSSPDLGGVQAEFYYVNAILELSEFLALCGPGPCEFSFPPDAIEVFPCHPLVVAGT